MTSKEALDRIKNNAIEAGNSIAKSNGIEAKDIIKTITIGDVTKIIYPEEELNIIEKDLELLEIVKKLFIENIYENDDAVYSDIMIRKDSDEYAKIKEFLKNEKE